MALALPGSRGLFSQMQESLCHVKGKIITLYKGVHKSLADFLWIYEYVANCPTRIYELVPLQPTVGSYHDASGYMYGGVVLPGPTAILRILLHHPSVARPSPNPNGAYPIARRTPFPKDIVDSLVSWTSPHGAVNNSDLELADGIIHSG